MKRLLLAIIICLTSFLTGYSPERKTLYVYPPETVTHIDWHEIDYLFKKYNIKYAQIVKAQVFLETGNLSSVISKTNKNLFGMRYAPLRETTAIGERYEHAEYRTFEDCIRDYKTWQVLYFKGGDYYQFLSRIGYATDKQYINKLKQLANL